MIKAVLWDFDDTLFDFTGSYRRGLLRHFAAEGLPCDDAAVERWHRVSDLSYARFNAGELSYQRMCRERVLGFLERPLADAAADAWYGRHITSFEAEWAAFPDVEAALDELPYRHGILSNFVTAHQERRARALGLRHRFEILLCADGLGCAKPAPAAFLAACAALDLPPAEVAYVGDQLDLDAVGAHEAGLHGIWLDRAGSAAPVPDGVHRIRDLTGLPGLLGALPGGACGAGQAGTVPVTEMGHGDLPENDRR